MGQFADSILRFQLKTEARLQDVFRKVVLDLDYRIVMRTPVDTGRARGNWQANIGPEPTATATENTSEAAALSGIEAVVEKLTLNDTVWLSNALPYIRVLEYGLYPNPPKKGTGKTVSGFSTQAVGGMVSVSAAEFGDIVQEVVG